VNSENFVTASLRYRERDGTPNVELLSLFGPFCTITSYHTPRPHAFSINISHNSIMWNLFCLVAQLVEALRYKPEGRGFDSR
jgi:hypothetical protein